MRPPGEIEVPFDLLFPMLVYYFAQTEDVDGVGGEWGRELNWPKMMAVIDCQRKITLTYAQLDSLIYSYKMGVVDHRRPFQHIHKFIAGSYLPLMQKLKDMHPDLFKEEADGEIQLIGTDPADTNKGKTV